MRIREIKAEKYRLFDSLTFSFGSSPCLIVIDDNERGKTTIVRAILDCLYTKKGLCETADKGRLQMSFSIEGDDYIAIVGNNKKRLLKNGIDITKEFYKKSGRSYEYLFGEGIFGLNEEEFCNTVLVVQQQLNRLDIQNTALSTKIQSMIELSSEEHSSSQAIRLLREGLSENYPRITVKTLQRGDVDQEIKNLNNKIDKLKIEHKILSNRLASMEDTVREFEVTLREIEKIKEDLEILHHFRIASVLQEENKRRERIKNLKEELNSLKPYPSLTDDEITNLMNRINGVYASYKEIMSSTNEIKEKIREREVSLKKSEAALDRYEDIKEKTSEDIAVLKSTYHEAMEIERDIEYLRNDIERRKSSFRFPYEAFSRMDGIFSRLSETEKHLLNRYRLDKAEIEDSLNRLERLKTLVINRRYALMAAILSLLISSTGIFVHWGFLSILVITILSFWFYLKNHNALKVIKGESPALVMDRKGIDNTIEELKRKSVYLDESLKALQERLGYTIEDYQNYIEWINEFNEIRSMEDQLNAKIAHKNRLFDNASKIIGRPVETSEIRTLQERIKEVVNLKEEISKMESEIKLFNEHIEQSKGELKNREDSLKEIASYIFNKTVEDKERHTSWDQYEVAELVEELLSMLFRSKKALEITKEMKDIRILSQEELDELSVRLAQKSFTPKKDELREPSYYEEQLSRLQQREKELHEHQASLLMKRSDIVHLKRRVLEIESELEYLENQKRHAEAYRTSVSKAIKVIEELSRDKYRLWAKRLNQETTEIFNSITGQKREIFFEKNLNFRLSSNGHELTTDELKRFLSGGAIEQLFLSIRLTIARHVCPHIKLPLILDEPFAHADDKRFLNAMRFLIDVVSKERQVVVFSCHRRRHEMIHDLGIEGYEIREGVLS